jgi:hypothetical protein
MLSTFNRASAGVAVVVLSVLVLGGAAFAVPYDPTTDVGTLATNAVTTMGPIVVALAGAVLGLAILAWALRAVFRMIGSGGRHI